MGKPSLAHEKLVELKERFSQPGHVDDVFLQGHRDIVSFAVHATNGCDDKLAALVELTGMKIAVDAEEKLREPAKLKAFFDSYHGPACFLNPQVTKDEFGRPVMPWTREIAAALASGAKTQKIAVEEPAEPGKPAGQVSFWGMTFSGRDGIKMFKYVCVTAAACFAVYVFSIRTDAKRKADLDNLVTKQLPAMLEKTVPSLVTQEMGKVLDGEFDK